MAMTATCPFCAGAHLRSQSPARVVYEDDRFYVVHLLDEDQLSYLGSLMTVTKRHVPSFAELTADEAPALGLLLARASRALKAASGAGHAYVYFFGEGVRHVHVFTVARCDEMPSEYVRLDVERWPGLRVARRWRWRRCVRACVPTCCQTAPLDSCFHAAESVPLSCALQMPANA